MICPTCQSQNAGMPERCVQCGSQLFPLAPGTLLASRYEILAPLGMGGMGVVYQARDRELDETIAVKILRSDVVQSPELAHRFRSEIKLSRRVRHRNVCGIHEYVQDGPNRFIVMEFIEGVDLRRTLQERGALPPHEAFDVALQVAQGLQAIHEVGIIHRDLKSSNLMRDARGVVRLMDFGIAKQFESEGTSAFTLRGQIVGTPEYMSPEQARCEKLDARSDLYAFGILIFELFTGQLPFRGTTPISTILKQIEEPPPLDGPRAASLPGPLIPVLRKALAKTPAERFASAAAMAEAIAAAHAASSEPAPVLPLPSRRQSQSDSVSNLDDAAQREIASAQLQRGVQQVPAPPRGAALRVATVPPRPSRPGVVAPTYRPFRRVSLVAIPVSLVAGAAILVSWHSLQPLASAPSASVPVRVFAQHEAPASPAAVAASDPMPMPTAPATMRSESGSSGLIAPAGAPRAPAPSPRSAVERPPRSLTTSSPAVRAAPDSTAGVTPLPPAGAQISPPMVPVPQPEPTPAPTPVTAVQVATLQIVVRPWAEVSIDGVAVGMTPLRKIQLAAGAHNVALSHPDYRPWKRRLELKAGESATLRVDLTFEGIPK